MHSNARQVVRAVAWHYRFRMQIRNLEFLWTEQAMSDMHFFRMDLNQNKIFEFFFLQNKVLDIAIRENKNNYQIIVFVSAV